MIKIIKNILKLVLILFLLSTTTFAVQNESETNSLTGQIDNSSSQEINYNLNIDNEIEKYINYQVSINTEYSIDLTKLIEQLNILYPEKEFRVSWDIVGASSQEGLTLTRNFREKGEKDINLTIYETTKLTDSNNNPYTEQKIFFEKKISVLVYEKIIPIIFSSQLFKEEIESYIEYSKQDGVYVYKIGPFGKNDIELTSIVTILNNYYKITGLKSDYIGIWGSRDFIFDILSKINSELATITLENNQLLNIVSISSYNIDILKNYLKNFLTNKDWINKIILINENSKFFMLKHENIENLESELNENQFDYIDVNIDNSGINKLFFISNFINNLSNLGYSTDTIYIFLIIPILFTIVSFFKHFIGISPIGLVIPVFLTEIFFKMGLVEGLILILGYVGINILLSIFVEKHNLLYTPKISFILAINVILFILFFDIAYNYGIVNLNLNDVIYFVVFIIISEKLINIMLSKDLIEYKLLFLYTILIGIFCYAIFNLSSVRIFILSFPELLVLFIPLNFLIGKFTGLRIAEYFRFKEVIKNIEE